MKRVTLDEWLKMSQQDRIENYKYLNDHERWQVRTCYEIPGGVTGDSFGLSNEERIRARKESLEILVELGRLTQEQADGLIADLLMELQK